MKSGLSPSCHPSERVIELRRTDVSVTSSYLCLQNNTINLNRVCAGFCSPELKIAGWSSWINKLQIFLSVPFDRLFYEWKTDGAQNRGIISTTPRWFEGIKGMKASSPFSQSWYWGHSCACSCYFSSAQNICVHVLPLFLTTNILRVKKVGEVRKYRQQQYEKKKAAVHWLLLD